MLDNTSIARFLSPTLLLATLLLGGCAKSFVVTSEVPRPLIEKLPVVAKMKYSDEFRNYQFIEKSDSRALEKVDFGAAQVGMFNQVFSNLFTLATPKVESIDLIIEPQILDFQYSVPAETNLELYEIWLKYRLRITDGNDKEIADWVVKGYGKTPTSLLASQVKAFNTASNVALRDIGAQLAIGFQSQPSIEDYLSRKSSVDSSSNPGVVEEPELEEDSVSDAPTVASADTVGSSDPATATADQADKVAEDETNEGSE